ATSVASGTCTTPLADAASTPYPPYICNPVGRIRRDKRRIRHLHRATGGCGVNALSALHVQSCRPDKMRQASHPAFIAPLRTG
ncbi:hypothetical protein, partial [Escherichia marmotae]